MGEEVNGTWVDFHSDGYGRTAHAAVNVKLYTRFHKTRKLEQFFERIGVDEDEFNRIVEAELNGLQEIWWAEDVQEYAKENGFSHVYSEGRGGGWAVPCPTLTADDLLSDPSELERFLKFKERVEHDVAAADDTLYSIMSDRWRDDELYFLERSVSVKVVKRMRLLNG
jgi:hypothetical protein